MLLTNIQGSRLCKASTNGSSANIKVSKYQLSKMIQIGGFFSDIWHNGCESIRRNKNDSRKDASKLPKNAAKYFVNRGMNELNKKNCGKWWFRNNANKQWD